MICTDCSEESNHFRSTDSDRLCHSCHCRVHLKDEAYQCKECDKWDALSSWMGGPHKADMVEHKICFSCQYWYEAIRLYEKEPEIIAIIDGRFYSFEPPNEYEHYQGTIHFLNGDKREYGFLGNGSRIPSYFRVRLPDNARTIQLRTTGDNLA